jgi:fatty aldehyde-generating acyl-ACP reductase
MAKHPFVGLRELWALFVFFISASRDLLILWLPRFIIRLFIRPGSYAFLIHPRDLSDIPRRFPVARHLPPHWIEWILERLWPVLTSKITGLRSVTTGEEKIGYIVACPLTPEQMHFDKRVAKRRILQTAKLAEKLGCKLIGLGALSASMSSGGEYLVDKLGMGITAGYAYTVAIILQMLEEAARALDVRLDQLTVAIVGAAGYMGVPCSQILSTEKKVGKLLLVDRPMKRGLLEQIHRQSSKSVLSEVSTQLKSLQQADFVIVVTNSVEILIRSEHLKPGAVLFDDSQPRNTAEALVWQRPDVLILDVMAYAPGINTHFPFDFPTEGDVFTCLGETLILAAHEWTDHFAIGHYNQKLVHQIAKWGEEIGCKAAEFRSFNKLVKKEKIEYIKSFYQHLQASGTTKESQAEPWISKTA